MALEWIIQQAFQQNNTKNKCDTLKEGANSISEKQGARGKSLVPLSNTVAIGNPERHMRKALHCGSKRQLSSHAMITLLLLVRPTYMYGVNVFHAHPVRGESHNQRNTAGEVATIPTLVYRLSSLQSHQSRGH